MDFVRLLGCAIGLFSTILVLYFVLYYYPLPFYNRGSRRSFAETNLKDGRKHAERRPGFRQGKVPVAERLHKAQRKRILGKKTLTDDELSVSKHKGRAGTEEWEGEQRNKGDRLDTAQTLDSNELNQAQRQDSKTWKQILTANRLHGVQGPDDSRVDRVQMLDERLNGVKMPDDRSRELESLIKEKSPDPDRLQEINTQGRENLLGMKIPDPGIKTPNDEQLQRMKTLYKELTRDLNPESSLLDTAQKRLLEQAIHKLYNEVQNSETNRLIKEKEKKLEAKKLQLQKERLLDKDWEAMRDRLITLRKDRLDSVLDEPLLYKYGKHLPIVKTPDVPSRPVPEEVFHGTEHMLGR